MPVVKQDAIGLYIESGGYVARPLEATDLKIGDRVEATHFGGSTVHGVGNPTLPRGHYRDYWLGAVWPPRRTQRSAAKNTTGTRRTARLRF